MDRDSVNGSPTPSGPKRVLFWLILCAIPLVALEGGLRAYFAYQLGSSILFYGTPLNREKGGDARSGDLHILDKYFKYHPHQQRFTRDHETGRLVRATINKSGFRGRDFETPKPPHVIRVVTLGASSTFGFSDRDDETYPSYLEEALNRERPGTERFEVLNLAIPHLTSGQILALFEAEALPLDPDVVTFYEGINDSWRSAVWWKKVQTGKHVVRDNLRKISPLHEGFLWLRNHFLTIALADGYMKRQRKVEFTEADLEQHLRGKSDTFIENVAAIYDQCRKRGITFIVASQQAKSLLIDRNRIKGITYEEEVELVRQDLARNHHITAQELYFLTHSVLMTDLEKWATTHDVPYVDAIGATDARRDCLVSWVHLNPEGHRIVAAAFARKILSEVARHQIAAPAPETRGNENGS
jgi:lysophospholipase L1-like esterase